MGYIGSNPLQPFYPVRKVFYSFCYKDDNWRVQQIRNMGIVDGNPPADPNVWEETQKKGEKAICNWIDKNLNGRSCTIVLIGENTAYSKYVRYEIKKSWELGMGVFGIYIHGLKDSEGKTSGMGENPFKYVNINGCRHLDCLFDAYNPGEKYSDPSPYKYIETNLASWIEKAIEDRNSMGL